MKTSLLTLLILAALFAQPAGAQNPIGQPLVVTQSAAMENSHVLKNAPGLLYSLAATTSGPAGYVMVDNATALPADGAVTPVLCYSIPSNGTFNLPISHPIPFSTGITAVFSTTGCTTQTKSASAFFQAQVK